jgi:hypothetical protein
VTQTVYRAEDVRALVSSENGVATRNELVRIFTAIRADRGTDLMHRAARTLLEAAQLGKIHGGTYWSEKLGCGCIVGWIGESIGVNVPFDDLPGLPDLVEMHALGPVESFARFIRPGESTASSAHVAALTEIVVSARNAVDAL